MTNYLNDNFSNGHSIDGLKLWNALQPHIEKGDLVVNVGLGDREGLVLVTYSKTYQYEHNNVDWEPLVKHTRGIIFDATNNYEIVALPFSKFFNLGEGAIHYPSDDATIESVFEKIDGSLGICFQWKGKWHITTRGSLNSDIGLVAQRMLDDIIESDTCAFLREDAESDYTFLFEIVYPENQIVIKYDKAELVYLGFRNIYNGDARYIGSEYPVDGVKWGIPAKYTFETKEEIVEWLNKTKGTEFEGVVVHFSDGSIFKIKSSDYMRLHRIVAQFTFKRVYEAVQMGTQDEIRKALPEELIPEFDKYISIINNHVNELVDAVLNAVKYAPKEDRKEFALYVTNHFKGSSVFRFVFKCLDLESDKDKLKLHIINTLRYTDFEVEEEEIDEVNVHD